MGLVNKAACVALRYHDEELTQFCYGKPKEGERISASFSGLETASEEDLDILNTLSLKRIGNMLCIRYADQSILCKRIPASKAETKVIQEQRLYKGFASLVKQYLIENRQMMYQETPLKAYFELLAQDKQLIGK